MLTLLELNYYEIKYTSVELVELGLDIASGKFGRQDIAVWIEKHLK